MTGGGLSRSSTSGWLVPLADLSLILFVITGAALASAPDGTGETRGDATAQAAPSNALADAPANAPAVVMSGAMAGVLVDGPQAPTLAQWLARHPPDPAGQLTVHATYAEGERTAIAARAADLVAQAIAAGQQPRLVIEPGAQSAVASVIAYDRNPRLAVLP